MGLLYKLERIPTGFQWMLLYFVWVIILSAFAILSLHLDSPTLNILVKGLLQISMVVGIAFGSLVIVSVLYVAKNSQNTKDNAIWNQNKQGNVSYPTTHVNRCGRIAYCLTYIKDSQEGKGKTGKRQYNAYCKQESFYFLLSPLSVITHILNRGKRCVNQKGS